MKAYFHSLEPVVMPRNEYIGEHRRLVKALETKKPELLDAELKEQTADLEKGLEGGGIKEDKRMINAKSPWTLAHLDMKVLQGFYKDPAVPPSMKTKLKTAMAMKPGLNKKLKGGLAGVSKASGFIQRMMAENKLKHSGQYKKPTDPAHKDSTMKQWRAFDYRQLANKDQGGLGEAKYGASPFIQKYFKGKTVPFTSGNTAKETEAQKEARKGYKGYRPRATPKAEPHADLKEHFGNVKESPKEEIAEAPTPSNPEASELVAPTSDAVHSPEEVIEAAEAVKERAELPDKSKSQLEAILAKAKTEEDARAVIEAMYAEEDKAEAEARRAEIEYANSVIRESEEEIKARNDITRQLDITKRDAKKLVEDGMIAVEAIDDAMKAGEFVATNEYPPYTKFLGSADTVKRPALVQEILKNRGVVKYFGQYSSKSKKSTDSNWTYKWSNWKAFDPTEYEKDLKELLANATDAQKEAFTPEMIQDRLHPQERVKHFGGLRILSEPDPEKRSKMFLHDTESPIFVRNENQKAFRARVASLKDDYEKLMLTEHSFIGGFHTYGDSLDRSDDVPTDDDNKRLPDKDAIALQKRQVAYFVKTVQVQYNLVKKFIDDDDLREKYNSKIIQPLNEGLDFLQNIPDAPSAPAKGTPPAKYVRKSLLPIPAKKSRDEKIADILEDNPKTSLLTLSKALKALGYEGTAVSTLAPIVKRLRAV